MNQNFIDNLEESVEDIPEQVKEFIFGEEMSAIKNKLRGFIPNQVEYTTLENSIMLFLLNSQEFETVANTVNALTVSEENKTGIRNIIKNDIVEELQLLMEILEEETPKNTTEVVASTTPTAATLSRINQTFSVPTTLAPTKRTYTEVPAITDTPKPLAEVLPVKPSVDPYRELPEVK